MSPEKELCEFIELFLVDVLKIAGHSVVTLWGETKQLLLWSPGMEFFKLVELYLGDGS